LEREYLTKRGGKDVAVVNLVMNLRVPQKFRKFLHQVKEKVFEQYDLSFIEFVSQFVRYNYLSVTSLRPVGQCCRPHILAALQPKLDLSPVATSQTHRYAMSALQYILQQLQFLNIPAAYPKFRSPEIQYPANNAPLYIKRDCKHLA